MGVLRKSHTVFGGIARCWSRGANPFGDGIAGAELEGPACLVTEYVAGARRLRNLTRDAVRSAVLVDRPVRPLASRHRTHPRYVQCFRAPSPAQFSQQVPIASLRHKRK